MICNLWYSQRQRHHIQIWWTICELVSVSHPLLSAIARPYWRHPYKTLSNENISAIKSLGKNNSQNIRCKNIARPFRIGNNFVKVSLKSQKYQYAYRSLDPLGTPTAKSLNPVWVRVTIISQGFSWDSFSIAERSMRNASHPCSSTGESWGISMAFGFSRVSWGKRTV